MILIIIGIVLAAVVFVLLNSLTKTKTAVKVVAAVAVALFISAFGCVKTVPTGHTGVVTTFGAVEDYTFEAGIHFISPLSNVVNIDNRTQKATLELEAFSSDIQEVHVVYTINYCIDKANAQNLYKTVGLNYFDVIITPKVTEDVKQVMAKYTAVNIVAQRTEVATLIEKELVEDLKAYNIQVSSTAIENVDFTDEFTSAVEAKEVAEQNKLQAQTDAEKKLIEAQAEADAKLIEAEAAAQANKLLEESLDDSILMKLYIEKWDGKLPTVSSDGSTMLNLSDLID